MKFVELVVLLPCHSLEDFPQHHQGEAAEGLLAAWSALWHPRLLASAGKLPTWHRVDEPPAELAGRLIVIPSVSQELPAGFANRAQAEGAFVIRQMHRRDEIIAAALAELDAPAEGQPASAAAPLDSTLTADFLTLGLCYLQTELVTRRMRYVSNLDEAYFSGQVMRAVHSLAAGNEAETRETLARAFEVLAEVRGHIYPSDASLIDLLLVAETTLGAAFRQELAGKLPLNVLISGEVVTKLAATEPQSLAALRQALDDGRATLVGGEYVERDLPLLSPEAIRAELVAGLAAYEKHLGRRPYVYGRRRYGLTPALPQILAKLGFDGALHVTLDDGQFPGSERSKTLWEGIGGSSIEVLSRVPLDANAAASFLSFPEKLGETMDHDHVATIGFAHWAGAVSPFFRDLQRMAEYGNVLGKFVPLTQYFERSNSAGQFSKFGPDQYRSPYLHQAIVRGKPDPISSYVGNARENLTSTATATLAALTTFATGQPPARSDRIHAVEHAPSSTVLSRPHECGHYEPTSTANAERALQEAAGIVVQASRLPASTASAERALQEAAGHFAASLPRAEAAPVGCLVVNPLSFSRKIGIEISHFAALPDESGPVLAAAQAGERKFAVVETPALGYVWLGAADKTTRKKAAEPIARDNVLRNEFCEVVVHPRSGGIQSIHDLQTRGNRLSQQIAFRLPPAKNNGEPGYTSMVAESVTTTIASAALGEVTSRGRLVDEANRQLATFTQKTQLWFASRVVLVEIELAAVEPPRADAWNSYYAARFAWPDVPIDMHRSVNWLGHLTTARRLEAPQFVELRSGQQRTVVLTAGLPFHQLAGRRMLDAILIPHGETCRTFKFGIGIDVPQPLSAALELMLPDTVLENAAAPPEARRSGWFFHLDVRSIVGTHWSAWVENGAIVGFRARLLETAGRPVRAALRVFRAIAAAQSVDFCGKQLAELEVADDRIEISFNAYEWIEVQARWK